jgi:flagellar biosynthesis component FlhA
LIAGSNSGSLPFGMSLKIVDLIVGGCLILAVVVMMAPISPWVMDLLLGFNLGGAVLLISLALLLKRPLGFAVLPTLLLISTLLRLGLNVASTRLILTRADAGQIIAGFGSAVLGGDILVGLVIFCIVALVLFLVITKGAERVAEVAARFSLDALPGLQAAIDAEARCGALTAHEAGKRRMELDRRSRYYGSLDGAMKFVRGDAAATMVILSVNLVGGLAVGTVRRGMGLGESLELYGSLTVGDGLVSLLPALLTSTAAGLLVTRVGQGDDGLRPGAQLQKSLAAEPRALLLAGILLCLLATLPGLPAWPFLLFGSALLGGFYFSGRNRKNIQAAEREAVAVVRLGRALVENGKMDRLAQRALEMTTENIGPLIWDSELLLFYSPQLSEREMTLDLWGVRTARFRFLQEEELLCMARPEALRRMGLDARRPLGPGYLIDKADGAIAKAAGLEVLAGHDLLATIIASWLCERAVQLATVESVGRLVEDLARRSPSLVREVVPRRLGLPALSRLLGELAEEGVGVQYVPRILEALAQEQGQLHGDLLHNRVRQRLRDVLTAQHRSVDDVVETISLGPQTESVLFASLKRGDQEPQLVLGSGVVQELCAAVNKLAEAASIPVLLVPELLRRPLRELLQRGGCAASVLAHGELEPMVAVRDLGMVEL